MAQAKKGGELGINKEFYKGGQFLPNYETTVKGAFKVTVSAGKKQQVAPYVWEKTPADDMLSIFDRVGTWCDDNRFTCEYVKGQGFVGFHLTQINNNYLKNWSLDGSNIPMPADWIEFISTLIEMSKSGEKFYPLAIDPFHYKNQ